jgi:pimeloyl-ACP methyl ester carboxylesterase
VHEIDVPTSVIVHTRDQLVPARRQRKLAESIPGAEMYLVEGDHFAIGRDPKRYASVLLEATGSVVLRAQAGRSRRRRSPARIEA